MNKKHETNETNLTFKIYIFISTIFKFRTKDKLKWEIVLPKSKVSTDLIIILLSRLYIETI